MTNARWSTHHTVALGALAGVAMLALAAIRAMSGGFGLEQAVMVAAAAVFAVMGAALLRTRRPAPVQEVKTSASSSFRAQALDAHAITFSWDAEGRLSGVNANFQRMFSVSHDVHGQPISALYGHRHLEESYVAMMRALNQGRSWHGEQTMRDKWGHPIHVELTAAPVLDADGRVVGGTAVLTDVSQRQQAQTEHVLTSMLEELQDELFVFDTDSLEIHYMNKAARDRCGWPENQISGKRITDTDPNFSEKAMRTHTAPLLEGTKSVVSITIEHANGPIEVTTHVFESAEGRTLFATVLRDVSDRRAVENARMQSVSVVSHELRAPLTSIKGSLRLLQSGAIGALPPEANSVIDIACRNSDRLLLVVNDILDLDKIQSGKMDFEMSPVDLRDLLKDALEMNKGYADEHDITMVEELPADATPMVQGNSDRLMQVLTNLMTNAIKYSPENGTVRITVTQSDQNWRVTVIDRGPGIPESSRKYLGQPFAQLAPADGRKRVGTGLGLTIVKSIVKRHNGTFGVDSVVGEGSEFYFDIPAAACGTTDEECEDQPVAAAG